MKWLAGAVLLLAATSAQAQFPNTYATSNSYGYNPNVGTIDPATGTTPGTVSITVAFSGSTTGMQMNNSGVHHVPFPMVKVGTSSSSYQGPGFLPAQNMAWSHTFSFDLMEAGCTWQVLLNAGCQAEVQPAIQCPIFGMIHIPWTDIQFETAITTTYISAFVRPDGYHPQAPFCSARSSPPDWPGPFKATPNTPAGEYAGAEFMYREHPLGTDPKGYKWQWGFSFVFEPRVEPQDFSPPDCTNFDAGFITGVNVFPPPGLILYP